MSSPLPTWQNRAALEDLFREVEGRDDVSVAVSVVGADRKERQVGSRPAGPGAEVLAWVDDLARTSVPAGGRLRVRTWKRGGKPVRGVVCVVGPSASPHETPAPTPAPAPEPAAPSATPRAAPSTPSRCPSCQRASARLLLRERRAAELDSTLGSERTRVIALQGENRLLRGEVAHWREEATRQWDRARRLEARLAALSLAANEALVTRLAQVEDRARPLVGEELPFLVALLVGLREGVLGARPRVPLVGDAVTSTGVPDLDAWASCLALGDIQGTLLRAA